MKHRLFFALWPDDETRQTLIDSTADAVAACGGKPVPPQNLHLTLRFLGEVEDDRVKSIRAAAAQTPGEPIELKLDQLGFFEGPQVFWLGTGKVPDSILRLVVNLNTELGSCGFRPEDRPFRPHVTLARGVERPPKAKHGLTALWKAEDFALVESLKDDKGIHYDVLERWPLRMPDF